jgi:hypothetical protein
MSHFLYLVSYAAFKHQESVILKFPLLKPFKHISGYFEILTELFLLKKQIYIIYVINKYALDYVSQKIQIASSKL